MYLTLVGPRYVLHCTALHCTSLQCTLVHSTTLHCTAAADFQTARTKVSPKHASKPKTKKESSIQGQRARPDISTEKVITENTTNKFRDDVDHIMPLKDKNLIKKKTALLLFRLFTPHAAPQGAKVRATTVLSTQRTGNSIFYSRRL